VSLLAIAVGQALWCWMCQRQRQRQRQRHREQARSYKGSPRDRENQLYLNETNCLCEARNKRV